MDAGLTTGSGVRLDGLHLKAGADVAALAARRVGTLGATAVGAQGGVGAVEGVVGPAATGATRGLAEGWDGHRMESGEGVNTVPTDGLRTGRRTE